MRFAHVALLGCGIVVVGCTTAYEAFTIGAAPDAGAGGHGGGASASSATASSGAPEGGGGAGGASSVASTTGQGGSAGGGGSSDCGNQIVEPGEECDDGNQAPDDGCDACKCSTFDPASQHCYLLVEGGSWTWAEAPDACPAGWQVASIESLAERDFVLPMTTMTMWAWIGGTDQGADEGVFEWLSGEPWIFTPMQDPWDPSEPNNAGDEDCVELRWYRGTATFNDNKCSDDNDAVLCELTP